MFENSYTGFRPFRETRCRIVLIGPVELGPRTVEMTTMTIIDELITLVENLSEEGQDYRDVRAIKRITHNLAKIAENLGASK